MTAVAPTSSTDRFEPAAVAQMERMLADLCSIDRARRAAQRELAQAHHEALLRLALAAEFKDGDTGQHIVRMGVLCERLALRLGEPPAFAALLRRAAPMHDIGKIGIPDSVLKKPGSLTLQERQVMNGHPQIGARILGSSRIPLFRVAAEVSLSHHERYNGAGYPHGLAGERIPLSGRIVALVDFFDAPCMDRVYRPAFRDDEAMEMLRAEDGRAFDPRIVATFVRHADEMIECRDEVNRNGVDLEALLFAQAPPCSGRGASIR